MKNVPLTEDCLASCFLQLWHRFANEIARQTMLVVTCAPGTRGAFSPRGETGAGTLIYVSFVSMA